MDTIDSKTPRTNKTTTTVIVGLATLGIGLVIGAAATQTGAGLLNGAGKAKATNQIFSVSANSPNSGNQNTWDPFQEIRNMQEQMDQSFNQMFEQFRSEPRFNVFQENPGYSLSLDVQDMKDHYEVRAFLPDTKASDVHVSLKNGRTLKVDVNSKRTEKSGPKNMSANVTELGQYEQVVQLPTPVKADRMKIKREGHELIITLPKAK
jgi:HSP20 family molecular chaperone IbpA